MAINYEKLMALPIPSRTQSYTWKESILYALGLGVGLDPTATGALPFVFEKSQRALPTMAVVLAHPGFWARDLDTGIDWVKVVHGEQALTIHETLKPEATVIGQNRVTDVIDKGEGRGALVVSERLVIDADTDTLLATVEQTIFCRGDGGFGGPEGSRPAPHKVPERVPDQTVDLETSLQTALIYRLSGDQNPLHADPEIAKAAGFPQPIIHGLATYGIAGYAILAAVCNYNETKLRRLDARFTKPAFPGETFRVEIWRNGEEVSFRVRSVERDVVIIDNGFAEIRA